MAFRQQRWTPDTCANPAAQDVCVWIEEWDDSVSAESRVHKLVRREQTCSFHAALTEADGYVACYDVNKRKNITMAASQVVKSNIDLSLVFWSYNSQGVLTINAGAQLTNQQKNQLQNNCNLQFGPGKVVVL